MRLVVMRGGGDLASGAALRLHRLGFPILILELEKPLSVRRTVCFSEAVYKGSCIVEGVTARLVSPDQFTGAYEAGDIPVLIDPQADVLANPLLINPHATIVVDARLTKQTPQPLPIKPALHIGLGPGFRAGENCDAVIETRRSHTLGRVFWEGTAQPDSGQPEGDPRRVLRAPSNGFVIGHAEIGEHVEEGQLIAEIQSPNNDRKSKITSPLKGVLRGLIHPSVQVVESMKIGDVDPRDDARACRLVSDKALAVGGGVLEAILSRMEFEIPEPG